MASASGPTSSETDATVPADEAAQGHPRGLYFLFFTEMWERFGYYGMRALLVLYMIKALQWQPGESSNVYKWYTSLVYLTPLAGGFIADRLLGLRASIVIGGALMAVGYFLVGVQETFYLALGLIIFGNGFFKPNISTLVGKMYKQGDARRDGAFTIFYMGINLGAFLAPLVCAWLRERYGYRWGFAAAGVGMLIGLAVFLVGQRRVAADVRAAGNSLDAARGTDNKASAAADVDAKAEATPGAGGAAGIVARVMPLLMIATAVFVPLYYGVQVFRGVTDVAQMIMPVAFSAISGWMGFTLRNIKGAGRDKSIVIFILFVFAILFWMAFEQAGNALNIWADAHTDLHIGTYAYPAEYFQSVNAILIFILAPIFAAMWVRLAKVGKEPSTATKMLVAMLFVALSFAAMVGAAVFENSTTSRAELRAIPEGIALDKLDAGRLKFDPAKSELSVSGVFPEFAVNEALRVAAPKAWEKQVEDFESASKSATADQVARATFELPPGTNQIELPKKVDNLEVTGATIVATAPLTPSAKMALVGAGAPREWRKAIVELQDRSQAARVSALWLILSYLLATVGELCLSPVGLSMVTKLAPVRYASLFMGVWLLASSVAQYAGGAIGESWGTITPTSYFTLFVWSSLVGVVLLVLLVRPIRKLMHGVH